MALAFSSMTTLAHAENGGEGLVLSDTVIFSLFVLLALIFMLVIYVMINTLKGILEVSGLGKDAATNSGNAAKAVTLLIGLSFGQSLFAQDAAGSEDLITMTDGLYWIMISLNAFLLGIIITLYYVTKGIIRKVSGVEEEEETSAIQQLTASLTDAVPLEREGEVMLDHNYDGIHELDNNLPPWWKYGFYFTILFSFIYLINYHVLGTGDLQTEEYNKAMAEAEIELEAFRKDQANLVDESNLVALTEAVRIESGKQVYIDNCQICHGQFGEGMVGPNLTDKYWKHGGGIENIYKTIKIGVPDKGMISWEGQLTPAQMLEVSSYILTMQGTDPPNAKAPEGDLWEDTQAGEAAPSDAEADEETSEGEIKGDQSTTAEEVKV